MQRLKKPDNLMLAIILLGAILLIAVFFLPPYKAYGFPPAMEAKELIVELMEKPGELKRTEAVFEPGSSITGSDLAKRLPLMHKDQFCLSTGQFAEDSENGFAWEQIKDYTIRPGQKIYYNGMEEQTVQIAAVCNASYEAILADIKAEGIAYSEGNDIKEACKICEGNSNCCAVILEKP